ncbi:PilN domain-containing protein [Motilimonas pumila]|uniref:Pilus assembly protein PilN n=1 Tax=Motilimonas pumila TaxID=2303987 RepID=A0A418YCY3_9GAMM|nr:PilN domain-containing protein [Motilimonas pumila]RJG42355.1 pilus assembly protein PilN [Motilimonas pumila]
MSNINLLPWREELRKRKEKDFYGALFLVSLVTAAIMFGGKVFLDGEIDKQNQRNAFLNNEITVLDRQIAEIKNIKEKKAEVEKRINLIQQLQERRNWLTDLFNDLPELTPNGVYLETLTFSDVRIAIKGKAESQGRASKMYRNIEESEEFGRESLGGIYADLNSEPIKLFNFDMEFEVISQIKDTGTEGSE